MSIRANIILTKSKLTWRSMDDVRLACKGKPVLITGNTLDLQNCQLDGSRLPHPDNDQDENALPLRIQIPGFILRGGFASDIPGGIWCQGAKISIIDLAVLRIGEDGISNAMDEAPNFSVIGCTFHGASDKSLQCNDGRGLTLKNNVFNGGITGCRIQKKATKFKNSKTKLITGNRFIGCETAWNIAGGIQVIASKNNYHNVNTRWVTDSGARYKET